MFRTYSFQDTDVSITHPDVGSMSASGEGIGSVAINMANDKTVHDTAADGSVMVSKIKTRSGTLALAVQQSSGIHTFLVRWINYLETAPASVWADTVVTVRSKSTGETITAKGVSPQKSADKSYQAQGQTITWNLMAADIQQDLV